MNINRNQIDNFADNYLTNINNGYQGYQIYTVTPTPVALPLPQLNPTIYPTQPLEQHQQQVDQNEQENEEEQNENQQLQENAPHGRALYVYNHRQVLATHKGKRFLHTAVATVVLTIVFILLATVAPWFQVKENQDVYYCKDNYLWVFLVPPLLCVPLLFSNLAFIGRLCWWHCWTVTTISVGVPALVVFISFGSSLIYAKHDSKDILWNFGAYFVIFSYINCILSGLLFMKLAHMIEVGIPVEEAIPPVPGPITVRIGVDEDLPKEEKFNDLWGSSGYAKE